VTLRHWYMGRHVLLSFAVAQPRGEYARSSGTCDAVLLFSCRKDSTRARCALTDRTIERVTSGPAGLGGGGGYTVRRRWPKPLRGSAVLGAEAKKGRFGQAQTRLGPASVHGRTDGVGRGSGSSVEQVGRGANSGGRLRWLIVEVEVVQDPAHLARLRDRCDEPKVVRRANDPGQ